MAVFLYYLLHTELHVIIYQILFFVCFLNSVHEKAFLGEVIKMCGRFFFKNNVPSKKAFLNGT